MKRFKLIRRLILLLIVLSLIVLASYTYLLSPTDYSIVKESYENKNITSKLNGFKIAYISDINLTDNDSLERLQNALSKLNENPFDMIVFGGDLYDGSVFKTKEVSAALKSITCKYGKFAILGDKDQSSSLEVTQVLNNGGFEVLENEARTLYYKDTTFTFIACDENQDLSQYESDDESIKICVAHQPDSFIKNKKYVDLQLSSHCYGGLLYIPFVGPMTKIEGATTYNHGRYEESSSTLIVSNGFSGPKECPYKLLARNQIHIITLKQVTS